MSQQLVKKGANGKHVNLMPKSWIEAIKDKNTGQTLVEILQGFNMYFLPYNGNTPSTRNMIPSTLRRKGLWISYVKYDGNVYTEWYAANEIDDTSWGDSSNWRVGNNTLVGDITISANGNWVINGTETEFKAVGEKGNTPLLRVANNRLQVSYDLGDTYRDVTNNPIYTKFRWLATTGDTQANNVGRIQASTDEGKTWTNMSNDFTNNLHISRYIGVSESLPTSGIAEGTIYAKGPYYAEDDTLNDNPIYRLWVYAWKGNTLAWQDNGEFTSIAAGVVQETGNSETEVMSQKAVTEKLSELGSKAYELELKANELDTSISLKDDFAISDDRGNDIVQFTNGHIKTKNFNSENIEANCPQTNSVIFSGCVDFNLDEWDITDFSKDSSVIYSNIQNAQIISKASFGIDNRDYSIIFSMTEENTQVVFGTLYEYNTKFSSAILVDSINNKVELLKAFGGTPVSLDNPVSISVPLTIGIYYKIDIKVRGRKVEFSIYRLTTNNCISFDLLGTKEYENKIIGYNSYKDKTWGYETGTWKGKSIIKLITGEVRLYGYQHMFACAKNPYIYCFGDSITEGFSVRDGEKYGDVLRSIFGENNVVISGIGGDTTTSSMLRFKSEVSVLRPYNVLLFLGSNYESSAIFKQNYIEMLQVLSGLKCNIILGTIPTQEDLTGIVKELAMTFKAKVVDFESLLKKDGILNSEYYYNYDFTGRNYNDNLHPNAIGEYLMATSIANIIK